MFRETIINDQDFVFRAYSLSHPETCNETPMCSQAYINSKYELLVCKAILAATKATWIFVSHILSDWLSPRPIGSCDTWHHDSDQVVQGIQSSTKPALNREKQFRGSAGGRRGSVRQAKRDMYTITLRVYTLCYFTHNVQPVTSQWLSVICTHKSRLYVTWT